MTQDNENMIKKLRNISKGANYKGLKKKCYGIRKWCSNHRKTIIFSLLLFVLPVLIILICFIIFQIPIEFSVSSLPNLLAMIAFLFSIITLVLHFITILDYPLNDLKFRKLTHDRYELQFCVENHGLFKLKLNLAFYLIEKRGLNEDTNKFFKLSEKTWEKDLQKLADQLEQPNSNMKIFSLEIITKEAKVFFSHNERHLEPRTFTFKEDFLYRITFYILTRNKIAYYESKYMLIEKKNKENKSS